MKLFPTAAAAALALMASSPAIALPATASDASPVDPLAILSADTMVSGYLDSLESLLGADPSRASALIQDLRDQWLRIELPSALKAELMASSEFLLQRLDQARLEREDIDLLRIEVVNARVSHGLNSLANSAASKGWGAEKFRSVITNWLSTTSVFNDAPDASSYRAQVTASAELSMLRTSGTAAASRSLTVEMLRMRLMTAIRRYQLAYDRGDLTNAEFGRLIGIAIIRVRRILDEDF